MHGDQSRCEENFNKVDRAAGLDKIFGDTNSDARSIYGSQPSCW